MRAKFEQLHPRNLKFLADRLEGLVRTHLWAQILLGLLLGVLVGVTLGPTTGWLAPPTATILGEWLALPGILFLTVIQMVVVPLVLSAIVRGIAASSDVSQLKRGGAWLAIYFLLATILATSMGIGLGMFLQPGRLIDPELMRASAGKPPTLSEASVGDGEIDIAALPEQIVSLLPSNPLSAMAEGQMLQVVLFAILIGAALVSLKPETAKPILDFLGSLQALCMTIVGWAMRLAPLAVFGLMARQMISTGIDVLYGVGSYAASVVVGMALLLGVYLLVVRFLGDGHPWRFVRGIRDAQLMAFSTDSSAATLPLTIQVAEDKLGVRPSISQFVAPIGATINMGGTALYQGLATVFMAQVYGMDLPVSALAALVVTALGASIGTPATPGVGIVVLATVLTSAGVPVAGLGLILGLDQLLERFRTAVNVSGDLAACTVMDRFVGAPQPKQAELEMQKQVEQIQDTQQEDVVIT